MRRQIVNSQMQNGLFVGNSPLHRNRNFAAVGGHLERDARFDVVMIRYRDEGQQIQTPDLLPLEAQLRGRRKRWRPIGAREIDSGSGSGPRLFLAAYYLRNSRDVVEITRQK